jgi:hypothetical protein
MDELERKAKETREKLEREHRERMERQAQLKLEQEERIRAAAEAKRRHQEEEELAELETEEERIQATREMLMELEQRRKKKASPVKKEVNKFKRSYVTPLDSFTRDYQEQARIREQKYRNLLLLAARAKKMAADPDVQKEELEAIDGEMIRLMGDKDKKRAATANEIFLLREELRTTTKNTRVKGSERKGKRVAYLEEHENNLQKKIAARTEVKGGQKTARNPQREGTVNLLLAEIQKVEREIVILKMRKRSERIGAQN